MTTAALIVTELQSAFFDPPRHSCTDTDLSGRLDTTLQRHLTLHTSADAHISGYTYCCTYTRTRVCIFPTPLFVSFSRHPFPCNECTGTIISATVVFDCPITFTNLGDCVSRSITFFTLFVIHVCLLVLIYPARHPVKESCCIGEHLSVVLAVHSSDEQTS